MSDDFISEGIKNVLINGIDLRLESPEEEQYYISKLFEYFDAKTEFVSYLQKQEILVIENSKMQTIVELIISNSTLYFLPYYQDEIFNVFTEVLTFIANEHTKIVTGFRGTEEFKIESPQDIKGHKNETIEEEEEESSSDDDYEWI